MGVEIFVELDHTQGSICMVAKAAKDGETLVRHDAYGDPEEAQDKAIRKTVEWLRQEGYEVPDHYFGRDYSRGDGWYKQPLT